MKYIILSVAVFICGCGYIGIDDPIQIEGAYYFSDFGGDETKILKKNGEGMDDIVIDARVDKFLMINEKTLAVTRTPRVVHKNSNIATTNLLDQCEYWLIDTVNNNIAGPFNVEEYMERLNVAGSNFIPSAKTITCERRKD